MILITEDTGKNVDTATKVILISLISKDAILKELKTLSDPKAVAGMARFGINPKGTYGVSLPNIRRIAKEAGKNHDLADKLWESGIHEARIIACLVDDPAKVTEKQLDAWVRDFDSWDVCDQCCSNLFDKTRFAYKKAVEWSRKKEEFVKRAGFVMMAALSVHDKEAADKKFEDFFPIIKRESWDERNYVKKAANWAIRQIGKRNLSLNKKAVRLSNEIKKMESKSAKWIASDALRELTRENVQKRLRNKKLA